MILSFFGFVLFKFFSKKMQRDINSLNDPNKHTRRRSLEKIQKELISKDNHCFLEELLDSGLVKSLLKMFSDPMERCRSIAITTVSKLVKLYISVT